MKTKTISYNTLATEYVDSMNLFSHLNEADEDWFSGIIVSPMLQDKIDNDDEGGADGEANIYDYAESIYQTFIIDSYSALNLYNNTSEIISYSEKLDAYFWHVCHFGTSWSGVHTEVREGDMIQDGDIHPLDINELSKLTIG